MPGLQRLPIDWYPIDAIHQPTTTTDVQLISREGRLYGWSFEETTATAGALVGLIDGSSNNGQVLASISLLANQSTRDIWGKPGIRCRGGVRLRVFSGSVRATIYYLGLNDEEIARQA